MYSIFNRISFLVLFALVVLLPVFFLPFMNVSVDVSKGLLLVIALVASVILWIIIRFSDGKIEIPRSLSLVAGGVIVLVFLFSALFSGGLDVSLFGSMLDVGSFWFIFSAFLLMLLSSVIFKEPKNAKLVLTGVIISSALVLVFQALHIFFPKISSFGVLTAKTNNILGSWSALGVFAGFSAVASLFLIEFFNISKRVKIALGLLVILSVAFIAVVNFVFVWKILGVFALFIFIYKISINLSQNREKIKADFPVFSFGVILISLFFFMWSGFIGGVLPKKLDVVASEVSPSFLSTMGVTKSVILDHPVLGIGPNRFAEAWALYKPNVINTTQFWDVSFNSGFGLIPTLTATTGLLGILSWIAFLLIFIFTGIKWLFFSIKNNIGLQTVTFFFLSLYLFSSSFFYFTGMAIFLLAFVFAGIFIGMVASNRKNGEISISFFEDHRKSFFFMLFLIILLILSMAIGFKYIQRFVSVSYFTKSLAATTIEDAETHINKALRLHSNDLYLRTYSQIYLLKLNSTASKGATNLSDADKAGLQASLDQAIRGAELATNYNSKNYLNFQALGSVFETAGLIGVEGGFEKALEAYKKSSDLNPANPRLKLVLSGVSNALEKRNDAKEYANLALTLKPDYIEALVALSQIAKNEGKTAEAISYAQKALSLSPGNRDLINFIETLRSGSSPQPSSDEESTTTENP